MKKKILLIIILFTIALIPVATFAKNVDLNFKDLSGAWYSDNPDECVDPVEDGTIGTYDGIPTAGLSSLQAAFVDKYHDIAAKLGQQYKIPWETVVAQGILESASGTSNFARTRNNFFGIGAFDSNPNNAKRYNSVEAGWRGYYENIKKTPTYRNHGVFSGKTTTDPYEYLKAIKAAGYATDPNYVTKVGSIIKAIENRSKKKGWQASSVLNVGGNTNVATTSTSSSSSSNVRSGVSSSTSSINKTALELAYPTMGNNWKKPKAEYKKALQSLGVWMKGWDQASNYGASCDVFVSTVVRYSGVDKNFKYSHPCKQGNYMANSDKFEEVAQSGYEAKAGDIQVRCDNWNNPAKSTIRHSRIVVENTDGNLALAHASHGTPRTGEVQKNYNGKVDKYYRIFRVKGETANDTDCVEPNSSYNGNDVSRVALELAWPNGEVHPYNEPKPAYMAAFKSVGLYDKYKNSGTKQLRYGSSCSLFVSTVLRYSGVSKDFAQAPDSQIDFMEKHSEIFEEVTNGYDKSSARPGDIQCYKKKGVKGDGHSRIVAQANDGKLHIVEAHLHVNGGQPAHVVKKEYDGSIKAPSSSTTSTFRVFRVKGGNINNSRETSSIGATAIKLAWPTSERTIKQTPAYKQAINEVGGFLKHSSSTCVRAGASCDRFVAIVVRYSGVDKDFGYNLGHWPITASDSGHRSGEHMLAHPELWEEVTEGYNASNAQDGDIHVSKGHVRLLAKAPDGKLHIVEASYCKGNTSCCTTGRVTGVFKTSDMKGYRAWRAKNNVTNTTSTVDNCACQVNNDEESGINANNGNINKTALALAWPNYRQHALTNPRPAYKKALAAVGLNHYGEKWVNIGASCDAFVATVMRYSGADKKFPCCGAANQMNYLLSHPEKYQRIPNKGNTSNLQPGDIRVTSGHIEIIVKRTDGSFGIAAASHADRTADVNNYFNKSGALIFRRKQ